MGRASREKPQRLAEKLQQIREALGLSQTEMLFRLGYQDKLHRSDIAKFELELSEPSLLVLLAYAQIANIHIDVLVDDQCDLPTYLLPPAKDEGISGTKSKRVYDNPK